MEYEVAGTCSVLTPHQFQLRRGDHGRPGSPMNRRGAEPIHDLEMIRRAVAFVTRESVFGVLRVQFHHDAIARNLRDYRGGRDTEALAIAADDSRLRKLELRHETPVDQHMLRGALQRRDSAPYREHRGPVDVHLVDLAHAGGADSERQGALGDLRKKLFAFLRRQLFRIMDALDECLWREYHGRRDH